MKCAGFKYFEIVIFYHPLIASFEKSISPLSVNPFLISSHLETEELLEKIKSIATARGFMRWPALWQFLP